MDEVGRGINVSLLGMAAVWWPDWSAWSLQRLFIWALATLLLVPVPCFVGSNITNHAMQLSHG
ncbi:hypothetical protein [Nocardia sp. NPDC049707]|uniref:hypothetical protein n=1 Tax=Nocardia sp. NPDC049707 TaxID=3154735 RepID=UPI003429ED59